MVPLLLCSLHFDQTQAQGQEDARCNMGQAQLLLNGLISEWGPESRQILLPTDLDVTVYCQSSPSGWYLLHSLAITSLQTKTTKNQQMSVGITLLAMRQILILLIIMLHHKTARDTARVHVLTFLYSNSSSNVIRRKRMHWQRSYQQVAGSRHWYSVQN